MHLKRVLSAVAFLPPFILLVRLGTPFQFFLLVGVAILLGLHEFYAMAEAGGFRPLKIFGLAGGLALGGLLYLGTATPWLVPALASLIVLLLVRLLMGRDGPKEVASRASITLLGMLYVAGLLSFPAILRGLAEGRAYVFYLAMVTWAGDTAAFYVGRRIGKRPLCPSISPGKTVEGGLGGLLASALVSWLATIWFWETLGTVQSLLLGTGLGVVGQVGDLCESMLKRSFGVKDAGALIPGHGGVLDRVDSLLFSGPALYIMILAGWV